MSIRGLQAETATREITDTLVATWRVQGAAESTIYKRLHYLGKVGGVDATHDTVVAYLSTIGNLNTRRVALAFLRGTFRAMIALGYIDRDPTVLVATPKRTRWQPDALSPKEVATLEAGLTGANRERFTLALYAGLRACELAIIETSWLRETFDGPMLRVKGKGGTDLSIPAHPKVVQLLESKPPGRLWNVDAKQLAKQVARDMHRLGVSGGIHRARHTFAMRVLQASDGDLLVVRDLMRHASVDTVQYYVSCLPNAPRRVLESIA